VPLGSTVADFLEARNDDVGGAEKLPCACSAKGLRRLPPVMEARCALLLAASLRSSPMYLRVLTSAKISHARIWSTKHASAIGHA
jgi:hypothetical protein